jgi:hypothetical protein
MTEKISTNLGQYLTLNTMRNYSISFCNNHGTVGKLDFNGPQMKFEGNADQSIDAFVRAFGHWFDGRLKQERESEREACAKVCDERAAKAPMGSDEQCEAEDCAKAIRARGEV